jgi:quercetin dioxygenase-like cupin family protein
MRVIETASGAAEPITEFDSVAATRVVVADGVGDAHAYVVSFEPGGSIGPHTAGFGQLFIPVAGSGWAAGGDGQRHRISVGQIAHIARGEVHSKGSDTGMTAVMVQVRDLDVRGG